MKLKYRVKAKITGWAIRNRGLQWQWTPAKTQRWLYMLMKPYGILVRTTDTTWTGRGLVRWHR